MNTPQTTTPITTPAAKRGEHVSALDNQGRPTHDRWGRAYVYNQPQPCPICGSTGRCPSGAIHR